MCEDNFIIEPSKPYSFRDDNLKEDFSSVKVTLEISTMRDDGKAILMNTDKSQEESEFLSNLSAWHSDTGLKSVDNFDSGYFEAIVNMREVAVPFIVKELKKGPTPLVHALDYIYNGEVEYEGYLPLEFVCKTWLEILKMKGISV